MKVAFLFNDRDNYTGGPAVNARRLLLGLKNKGINCIALVNGKGNDFPNTKVLIEQGIDTRIAKNIKYTRDLLKWIFFQLKDIQPDIFVANTTFAGGLAKKYLRKSNIPVVFAHRSDDEINWLQSNFFTNPKLDYCCDALVCVNEYLEHEVKRESPKQLTKVIPSGVPITNHIAKFPKNHISFVYAGRIIQRQKRILTLVSYFVNLNKKYSKFNLTIIGEGEELVDVNTVIKTNSFQNKIQIKNVFHNDEEYKTELSKHHYFIMFSDYEGMPGSLMDAMSCGLIPIVHKFSGVEEIITHERNGFLFKDEYELDNIIEKLTFLPSERFKTLSDNARNTIINRYSNEILIQNWIDLFERLKQRRTKKFIRPIFINISVPSRFEELFIYSRKPFIKKDLKKISNKLLLKIRIFLSPLKQKLLKWVC